MLSKNVNFPNDLISLSKINLCRRFTFDLFVFRFFGHKLLSKERVILKIVKTDKNEYKISGENE